MVTTAGPTRAAQHLETIARYRRATNYLAAAQVYLKDNVLLEEPLRPEHIKDRLLGHWGTSPGINLVYAHLNRLILEQEASVLLITGPGHGAAANHANLYLEGTLEAFYPHLTRNRAGLERFVRGFSWPGGFPSHLSPEVPGTIHEGGELGYALATAFGAAMDNPDLVVACIVGDGEAETGPTATAWHGIKFLDPVSCGAVLPIVHLNGYKISSPTIYGTMSDAELESLFTGYGYAPRIVDGPDFDAEMADAVDWAYGQIREIQQTARAGNRAGQPRWPMVILRSPKGWTGPHEVDGVPVEGTWRAHQVPAGDLKTNPAHLALVEAWLRSYKPEELFDADGRPVEEVLACCPSGDRRMGMNPHAYGGRLRHDPHLPPNWETYGIDLPVPGAVRASSVSTFGNYLRDAMERSRDYRTFRIFSPDELESNRLGAVLDVTNRAYVWPTKPTDSHLAPDGLVVEMLSEHTCQGMLQGYLLTGRHGLFPCYEAFVSIVDSMLNQYAKFLKVSAEVPWREPVSSLNYLLTSESWRQDHNGYSHQGPGFINHLLTKKASMVRIYLPPDANCLVQTMDHVLWSKNYINLVIAAKQPLPQWLDKEAAAEHCRVGASIWRWASTDEGTNPDVVLAAAGDNPTLEMMAAVRILQHDAPELRVRVVNVTDLMVLGLDTDHPHGLTQSAFEALFTADRPVIFNFHGYPSAIKGLIFGRSHPDRFQISGYQEEGTTTTPFDMHVRNGTSRYHLVMRAARQGVGRLGEERIREIVDTYTRKLAAHREYIQANGVDPIEISEWTW